MPIYMDVHIVPGVKAKAVAEAHNQDLLIQDEQGCKCMTYWIDEVRETVFCLIEAPNKEAVSEMHQKAHGLIPHKIIEVDSTLVQSFLGRIYDPADASISPEGLKVFNDPSFRVLIITKTHDPVLLKYTLGPEKTEQLLNSHYQLIRRNGLAFGGREVEHEGSGFIFSFTSAGQAVSCALSIHNEMPEGDAELLGFRMGINSGEPVQESNRLFGDTIQQAQHLCSLPKKFRLAMTSSVRALVSKQEFNGGEKYFMTLTPADEALLQTLFKTLEENWQNADFDVDDYCKAVAMSKSQLYRKVVALTGLAPNVLIKEFRLEKAKELMKKQYHNIAQVTFDSGFSSPSYFTKCFKKKYGLLPMNYVGLLQ